MNDEFDRIKRLPPYVFAEVNRLKAELSLNGNDMTHFAIPFIYLMIGSTLFLSACGVKGDLYLPNQTSMIDNITNESQ